MTKEIKPELKLKNVFVIIIMMMFCVFIANTWNDIIWKIYLNKLLYKYYSQEDIINKNLFLIYRDKNIQVSNGDMIPFFEYSQLKHKIIKWSYIPAVIIAMCWFIWFNIYLRKFNIHTAISPNLSKSKEYSQKKFLKYSKKRRKKNNVSVH
ncbi:MAG: hypothetical protein LBC68_03275 [Prevotellaceae bacterium]|jgi:hypothetical protein|nr:hypothetical protein [Prevotellaceae bacterium]